MKYLYHLVKPTFLVGFISCFSAMLFLAISIESNHLERISLAKMQNLLNLSSTYQQRFDNTLNDYDKIISLMYPDESLINDSVVDNTEFNTFRRCNISEKIITSSGVQISPVNTDMYRAIPLQEKLNIRLFCNLTRSELRAYTPEVNQQLHLGIVIERPDYLFSDFLNTEDRSGDLNEEYSNINAQWVVSSSEMPLSILENTNFKSLRNIKNQNNDSLYTPEIFIHQRMFENERSVFFGPLENLFHFETFDDSPSTELIHQMRKINEYAAINYQTIIIYSPIIMIISMLIVLFITYVINKITMLKIFFNTLNNSDHLLLAIATDTKKVKSILGNPYDDLKCHQIIYLDESLKPVKSIVKAKYINFKQYEHLQHFRVVASTFLREGQLDGYVLLIEASGAQNRISEYELVYRRDALTKLPNRTELDDFINKVEQSPSTYLMSIVDLDHFKKINDNFGHHFGDLVLQHSANHLKSNISTKENDRIIRLGGEEFMILLETSEDNFDQAASSIAKRILDFNHENISFSGGVTLWQTDQVSFDSAYKQCDKLLYEAKQGGRRQIKILTAAGDKIKVAEKIDDCDVISFKGKASELAG